MFGFISTMLQRITSLLLHWRFSFYRIAVDVGRTTHPLFAIAIVLFIRMALNALDGMLAREAISKHVWGRF